MKHVGCIPLRLDPKFSDILHEAARLQWQLTSMATQDVEHLRKALKQRRNAEKDMQLQSDV